VAKTGEKKMSFGRPSKQTVWILIALIPIAASLGFFLGWALYGSHGGFASVTLEIKGSTTVEPICLATAPLFEATHPGIQIGISAAGSGTGISAVIDGTADIGMSSRQVKTEENITAHDETNLWLRSFAIAKDALVVITNAAATTTPFDMNLTLLRMIFNGTISSWDHPSLAGHGLTGAIQVIARESTSGTRTAFDEMVMGDDDYASDFQEKVSNQEVHDEIASNPQAIGYIGLAYMSPSVKDVLIDGINASKEHVRDGSYELSRSLFLVTLGIPNVDSLIWEYVQWHLSPTAQNYVEELGYIAVQAKRDDFI